MKRMIIKLSVFLLLGAMVNVAVAWGFAWRANFDPLVTAVFVSKPTTFSISRGDAAGATWIMTIHRQMQTEWLSIRDDGIDVSGNNVPVHPLELSPYWNLNVEPSSRFTQERARLPDADITEQLIVIGAGWPARSLQCYVQSMMWGPSSVEKKLAIGSLNAIDANRPLNSPKLLPAVVIWPGFAINTVFYAGILWLLFAAPGRVRRWRRIRRGLCVKCSYPLGTSDVCTECGSPLGEAQNAPN